MAKVFQRKKGGRYIGTFYVRGKNGRPVPLGTKDAREANRRARLYFAGKWPPAEAAADAAKVAEQVPPPEPPPPPPTESIPPGIDPPAPPVTPGPASPGAGEPACDVDPVEAAAAAAADVAGVPGAAAAPGDEEQARREEWGQRFAQMFGGALNGAMGASPGAGIAAAEWYVVSQTMARVAARKKPPVYIYVKKEDLAVPLSMLAMAWDEQLRRWGLDLAQVEPWMAIVAGTAGLGIACAMGMSTTPPPPDAAAPDAPSAGAGT